MAANFDLKNISPREIAIIAVTILSAVCYGFYEFEYKVQQAKLKDVRSELSNLNVLASSTQQAIQQIGSLDSVLKETEMIREEIGGLREEISVIKSRLIGKSAEVLNGVQKQAEAHNVILKSMRTKEGSITRGQFEFKELLLVLVVQSEYESLKNFLAALEEFPAVIQVISLETVRKDVILPEIESRMQIKITAL